MEWRSLELRSDPDEDGFAGDPADLVDAGATLLEILQRIFPDFPWSLGRGIDPRPRPLEDYTPGCKWAVTVSSHQVG